MKLNDFFPSFRCLLVFACILTISAHAQALVAYADLPEAPSALMQAQADAAHAGSITGVVSDIRGGLVPGAHVHLELKGQPPLRELTSDSAGRFTFTDVPPGVYTVRINATGLESFVSEAVNLKAGERFELPEVALPIATASTSVDVAADSYEVAEQELKLETQQRLIGIFPNFYTSFLWNAAPLHAKQKFKLSTKLLLDPITFATTAVVAGLEQANNTFPGYGDDAESYGKRYGAAYADAFIGRTLGSAVFPSIFRQDPRYFFMGPNHSFKARFKHAALSGLVARGDNGKWQPNFSHIAGNAAAGAISTVYHPDTETAGSLAARNALIGILGGGIQGLVREFVWPHLTHKIPAYATGKPAEHLAPVPTK